MASVFLATDTKLDSQVALKKIHPHLLNQKETIIRFTNEAKAIAQLSHENIIKIFDYGGSDSQPFLVMEYVNGTTLQKILENHNRLPDLVTAEIAFQVASGLLCAHNRGIFHRDIKPANILFSDDGYLRITDFGIAYLVNSESITMTGAFLGSPHYISPEQAEGRKVKGTTDIFSLGIILYQFINFGMKTTFALPGDTVVMPVFLANYEEFPISACQFKIEFDQSKLKLLDISKDSGLIRDWPLFDWNISGSSVSIAMGGTEKPLGYGEGELIRCTFLVKKDNSQKDTCIISLSDILIDESYDFITATSKSGRIIIGDNSIIYGDVTGNGEVNIFDAQKVLQYVVGSLVLPDPSCPNFTTAVADVSGNGTVSSYDAALIFQHSIGLRPQFPVEEPQLHKALSKSAAGPKVAHLSFQFENKTDYVELNLVGSNLKGFIAGEFSIQYDSKVNISQGSIKTSLRGATLNSMIDPQSRHLKIAIAIKDDVDEDYPVTLASIILPPSSGISGSSVTIKTALLNEGKILSNFDALASTQPAEKKDLSRKMIEINGRNLIFSNSEGNKASLRIYSLSGKLLMNKEFTGRIVKSSIRLDLTKGLYIYQIKTSTGMSRGRFVIKE